MKLNLAEKFRNPKFYYFITTDNKVNVIGFGLAQIEAGATFDNSFFDNCFVFLQQLKNRLFSDTFSLHHTGRREH